MNSEFSVITNFTRIIGLPNKTNGTLWIYKKPKNESWATKPDGYYYYEGVTFILDAKAKNKKSTGQLEDYMNLEKNPNYVGFFYSPNEFKCYIRGKLLEDEKEPKNYKYYLNKFFSNQKRTTDPHIVVEGTKKLAKLFREAGFDKRINVPFIGAVMICLKASKPEEWTYINNTTQGILELIKNRLEETISNEPITRREKKDFLKTVLDKETLKNANFSDLIEICGEISHIYNYLNVSDNQSGHDVMNNFLNVFRKWDAIDSKEKGEVFTPDHIAQLMCKLIDLKKTDYLLDPCCGSGTFLTNGMAFMLKTSSDEEEKNIKENNIIGFEIKHFNACLAGINMMLHDDGASKIFCCNCFKQLPKYKNKYNKVLMNPPFSQKDSELKFVFETLENMRKGGFLASIVPISTILSSNKKTSELKKKILDKHDLIAVIRLPKKLFFPNASVQTAIILLKAHYKYSGRTWRKNLLDDGYIELRNVGRVEHHNEQALKIFFNSSKEFVDLKYNQDWPQYEKINFFGLSKFDFMRQKLDFMRQKLDFMLVDQKLEDVVINNFGNLSMDINVSNKNINFKQWKKFKIGDLFKIEKGKEKSNENNPDNKNGKIPLIIASSNNNGVGYYIKEAKKIFSKNTISLVIQGDGASGIAKAHSYDYAATSSVVVLSNSNLTPWTNIFISTVLSKLHDLYDFTYSLTLSRLSNQYISLPVDKNGCIDYQYMEKYIKNEL